MAHAVDQTMAANLADASVSGTLPKEAKEVDGKVQKIRKKISLWADVVTQEIRDSCVVSDVLELQNSLTPVVETLGHRHSAAGRLAELQEQLSRLHSADKVLLLMALSENSTTVETHKMATPSHELAIHSWLPSLLADGCHWLG